MIPDHPALSRQERGKNGGLGKILGESAKGGDVPGNDRMGKKEQVKPVTKDGYLPPSVLVIPGLDW